MREKIGLNILNAEEESVNTIMFAAWIFVTVAAFVVVVGFQ